MKRWGHTFVFCAIAIPGLLAQRALGQNIASAASISPATMPSTAAAARTFHDPNYKITIDFPGNWVFTRKDGEISTFRLDARSAARNTTLRAVAAYPENPFPASTFSGAYIYFSVTPHSSDASCARQTVSPSVGEPKSFPISEIGGIRFTHGHDEQKHICTTDRDEIYTTYRRGACYRFDLAINNFCGGEVSGVKDITPEELDQVRSRMESVLSTVRFDSK